MIEECILASTRPTHGNTHNTRPFTSHLQQATYLPLRKLLSEAVTCSRPAPSRTLVCSGSINASPAQASARSPTSPFASFAHTPYQPHPNNHQQHHFIRAPTIAVAASPALHHHLPTVRQSRIHEVVLPASASRAYHLQPRLSNDRHRHALAPGAFI